MIKKKTVYLDEKVAKQIKIQAIEEDMKESELINYVLKEYICFMKKEKKESN